MRRQGVGRIGGEALEGLEILEAANVVEEDQVGADHFVQFGVPGEFGAVDQDQAEILDAVFGFDAADAVGGDAGAGGEADVFQILPEPADHLLQRIP